MQGGEVNRVKCRTALMALTLTFGWGCTSGDTSGGTVAEADGTVSELDGIASVDSGATLDGLTLTDLGGTESDVASVDVGPGNDGLVEPAEDPTQALYPADRAIVVEVTMDPDHWDELRAQTRTLMDILGPACGEGPYESPFTYFPATVTVEGETVENVGVRKKGFLGSLSDTKPSLKIKAHEFEDGKTFSGMKRLTLNNVQQDPGYMSTCLSYDLFNAAGIAAPRCGFADVTVNGEHMGLFVSIDSLKKPFMKRNFGDDSGTIYEGTISDFREGWTWSFEQKTNEKDGPGPHIDAVKEALEVSDDELLGALDAVIDLDRFMTFWALEVIVGHWDGYAGNTNNYYLYAHPDDQRLLFIPWGADATFARAFDLQEQGNPMPYGVLAQGLLARRLFLHPEGRAWYLSRLQWVLDEVWSEDAQHAQIDRMQEIIAPLLFPHQIDDAFWKLGEVRNFVDDRRDEIEAELAAGGPVWDSPLRDSFCWEYEAEVLVTFDTYFGSISVENPYAASGSTTTLVPEQADLVGNITGVQVGMSDDPEEADKATIRAWTLLEDGSSLIAAWNLPPEWIEDGATIMVDFDQVMGFLIRFSPSWEMEFLGYMGGEIHIIEGSAEEGAPFKASASGLWFLP
ncbi:MAG: hypothetical protein CL940_02540 [Deltaproteobacteria bacterium]|nr:hypothetical protein [Deltaproteobacteria bacterium]